MKNSPTISFIIATKDRAKIIVDTLDSLLQQTNKNWEAVIVDEGNDMTKSVIEKYNDKRFRYFKMSDKHGSGAGSARNIAALLSKGEICAILDSDDIAYPQRAQIIIDAFSSNRNLDVFYSNIEFWNEESGVVLDWPTKLFPFSTQRLQEVNFVPHSTLALKRELLVNNPYNSFFKMAEDYDLVTRLANQGYVFGFSKEKLVRYRFGTNNVSTGNGEAGEKRKLLTQKYADLVRMTRGYVKYDPSVLDEILLIEQST